MLTLLGLAVLAFLATDVVVTVFQPHGQGGPMNRVQNRVLWRFLRAVAERLGGGRRGAALALGGPLLAVLTIVNWSLLLVAGYALLYYPRLDAFAFPSRDRGAGWVEAVYYSGYSASTLGLGDVVPTTAVLQLATVAESLSGFLLFAIAVTYVLAVYREIGTAAALALSLRFFFVRGPDAVLSQVHTVVGREMLVRWANRTTHSLIRVAQAHAQYPILHYFRPAASMRSLPVQLGGVIALLRRLDRATPNTPEADLAGDAAFVSLRLAVERFPEDAGRQVLPARFDPGVAAAANVLEREHARLRAYLGYEA